METQNNEKKLSACETLIMKLVWDAEGDISVQKLIVEIRERYGKDYARTTVVTFVKKLMDKGYVSTYRVGRASFVHAERDEYLYKQRLMSEATDFWFEGKPSGLLAAVCSGRNVPEEEILAMRKLLDELEK
ncbi:MAG: BlaI/MecI/CopY family transcriptional regulator [Clostridiales bacterium]|nr:BlaI/MecI/CopY family transcriptional regulator [Clostridiales bacterium]MCD8132837.1 BlaI/MecI/CopY family transcriptional regulator [Clostridiales bacterium]